MEVDNITSMLYIVYNTQLCVCVSLCVCVCVCVCRVMELPYAFQCCAFVSCEKHANPWEREDGTGKEEFARRDAILTNQGGTIRTSSELETVDGTKHSLPL